MDYKILWHEKAIDDLSSLDKKVARRIVDKVENHLIKSPEEFGKPLKGTFSGFFRYRIGDYRVVYYLDKEENTLKILNIGHRKEIYKE